MRYSELLLVKLTAVCLVASSAPSLAQSNHLNELLSRTEINKSLDVGRTVSCDQSDIDKNTAATAGQIAQYIYNAMYIWEEVYQGDSVCIVVLKPEGRILTALEATLFLQASRSDFPPHPKDSLNAPSTPEDYSPPDPVNVYDTQNVIEYNGESKPTDPTEKPPQQVSADPRFELANSSFPFNTVALVQTGTSSASNVGGSSAVQVSPYLYITAAHVLADRGTGILRTNVRVFPAHNLPHAVSAIKSVAAVPNPLYISSANSASGAHYDVGFIKTVTPRSIGRYPRVWLPYPQDVRPVILGSPFSDPWSMSTFATYSHACVDSWRRLGTIFSPPGCGGAGSVTATIRIMPVGYPNYVGNFDNRYALKPFSQYSRILGNPSDLGFFYNSSAKPALGISAFSSSGDSGGPIFGIVDTSWQSPFNNPPYVAVLGIMGGSVPGAPSQPYSVGAYRTNSFWPAHLGWEPNFSVHVDVPSEGFVRSGTTIDVQVGAPGVPQVEVYERHDAYGGDLQFIGLVSDYGRIPRRVSAEYNEPRTYTYEVRAHPDNSIILGTFSVRACVVIDLPWGEGDHLRRPSC